MSRELLPWGGGWDSHGEQYPGLQDAQPGLGAQEGTRDGGMWRHSGMQEGSDASRRELRALPGETGKPLKWVMRQSKQLASGSWNAKQTDQHMQRPGGREEPGFPGTEVQDAQGSCG